jgi:hypothetical protein
METAQPVHNLVAGNGTLGFANLPLTSLSFQPFRRVRLSLEYAVSSAWRSVVLNFNCNGAEAKIQRT